MWTHILATLWLLKVISPFIYRWHQVPNIFFQFELKACLTAVLIWSIFFPAAGEQFLLISLDHLHNIHGQLKEGICGGGHELVVIALDDLHATELSASYFCMAVFKEMNYDATVNSTTSSFKLPNLKAKTEMNCFLCIVASTCLRFWLNPFCLDDRMILGISSIFPRFLILRLRQAVFTKFYVPSYGAVRCICSFL